MGKTTSCARSRALSLITARPMCVRAVAGAEYEFGGDLVVRSSRRGPGCDLPFTLGQKMHVGVRSGLTLVGEVLDDSTRNRRRQRFAGSDDADGVR
jgi:hypothetical protein